MWRSKSSHLFHPKQYNLLFISVKSERSCHDDPMFAYTGCIKMIGEVLKLIIFTSMVNRIINTNRNERVTEQVYDTYLQMYHVCTLRHMAHIEAIVQFLPYSAQKVRCDGLHSRGNCVSQNRYVHGLWWHKHFVLHVTSKEVVTRG